MSEPFRAVVLQWAHEGRVDELAAVEDQLTAIARRHGDVTRERGSRLRDFTGDETPPDEVHILTFPDEAAFDAFLEDPDLAEWSARLRAVMARTLVVRLTALDEG